MNRFQLARYRAGISLKDAAERAGVGRTTLSRIENGHIERPSAEVVHGLAAAYEIEVDVLLGLKPMPERKAAA